MEDTNKKPQLVEKETLVARIAGLIDDTSAVVFSDYRGLTVAEDTILRRRMREAGVTYEVVKNTLIKRAYGELGEDLNDVLAGPTAIAFANDPVALAKLYGDFIKEFKKTQVKAGVLDGKIISAADVDALAKLPSREVLLGKLLGAMQSPMYGFAGVTTGMLRQLVTVTDKIREQKAAAQA